MAQDCLAVSTLEKLRPDSSDTEVQHHGGDLSGCRGMGLMISAMTLQGVGPASSQLFEISTDINETDDHVITLQGLSPADAGI